MKIAATVGILAEKIRLESAWRRPEFQNIRSKIRWAKWGYLKVPERASIGVQRFGKRFLAGFGKEIIAKCRKGPIAISVSDARAEAIAGIALTVEDGKARGKIAEARLGFEKDSVFIEAFQGKEGHSEELAALKDQTGITWAEILVGRIETRAKSCGFGKVKIARPENLKWYTHITDSKNDPENQARMRALYYGVAKSMGYRKEKEFFVKDL